MDVGYEKDSVTGSKVFGTEIKLRPCTNALSQLFVLKEFGLRSKMVLYASTGPANNNNNNENQGPKCLEMAFTDLGTFYEKSGLVISSNCESLQSRIAYLGDSRFPGAGELRYTTSSRSESCLPALESSKLISGGVGVGRGCNHLKAEMWELKKVE
ncbi:hypothetical protein HDV05_004136 [Chytridiales sp. JEL 0842]|nr:hypothetical protein HDV05_004136 [Chytridiales sp. JEL 0842]